MPIKEEKGRDSRVGTLQTTIAETDVVTLCIMVGIIFILALLITAVRGNVLSLKLLRSLGIPLNSGKQDKDFKVAYSRNKDAEAHLFIKNVCYSPVYQDTEDFSYTEHNANKKPFSRGELHLRHTNTVLNKKLKELRNEYDKECNNDLLFIKGNTMVKTDNPTYAQFTNLRYFTIKDFENNFKVLTLYRNGKVKNYVYLAMKETSIDKHMRLDFTDRESFLHSIMKGCKNWNEVEANNLDREVVILSGGNDIEALIVLAIEVGGTNHDGEKETN